MKRNALLIGGFVVVGLVIVVVGVLWLSGGNLFHKQQEAVVYFKGNVSGLYVGAPVSFRGVPIGQVESIGIEVDHQSLKAVIPVSVRLRKDAARFSGGSEAPLDLPELVQRGLRARLVAQSFVTGQKSVELDFVPNTPATPALSPGARSDKPEIPALGDKFDALIDQVADLPLRETVQEVRDTVKELRNTLGGVQHTLDAAQGALQAAAQQLDQTGAEARVALKAATDAIRIVQAQAGGTLSSVTQLSNAARDSVVNAQPDIQRTLAGTRDAAESARLAMSRVAEMTAPNASLRADLDAAVRDLSQAARGLRDWSELLEEKPNAVIFGSKRD